MFYTNNRNYPKFIVDIVKQEMKRYSKGDSRYSVTELIGSPLPRILKARHEEEMEIDIDRLMFMFFGNMAHAVVEKAKQDYIMFAEKRMFIEVNGVTISGQLDVVYKDHGKLILDDVKFTGKGCANDPAKKIWVRQANVYRYMLHKTENILVDELGILAFFRNSTMFEMKCARLPIKPFTLEKVQSFLEKQVGFHMICDSDLTAKIPECTPDDRWCTPESWVVMPRKGKTVRALPKTKCDSEPSAAVILGSKLKKYPDAYVEHRPEVNMKCEMACDVAKYCWWWQDRKQKFDTNSYNLKGDDTPKRTKTSKVGESKPESEDE